MKKYLILIIVVFIANTINAQYYTFLTFGYNGALSNGQNVVNTFVKDYNSTRPYLTQKMNTQDFLQGFTGSWGWGSEGVFLDLMYTNKYSLQTASGTPPGYNTIQRRDVRFTYNSMSLAIYFINFKKKSFRGPGFSVDIGKIRQRTRTADASTIETTSYSDIAVNKSVGLTLCYDFKTKIVRGIFLGLRPYYQLLKCDADISTLAQEVNHGFSGGATKLRGGNYGLQINIGFGTYHDD